MKFSSKILIFLLFVIVAVCCVIVFLPWKSMVEAQIREQIIASGIINPAFKLENISHNKIKLSDVQFGNGLQLKSIELKYSLLDLMRGRLDDVIIKNLSLEAVQQGKEWSLKGILPYGNENSEKLIDFPDTHQEISDIALGRMFIDSGVARIVSDLYTLEFGFDLEWNKEKRSIVFKSSNNKLMVQGVPLLFELANVDLSFKDGEWDGRWLVKKFVLGGYVTLDGKGEILIKDKVLKGKGVFEAQDKSAASSFEFEAPMIDFEKINIKLGDTSLKWANGVIKVPKMVVPLDGKSKIKMNVEVVNIGLQELLSAVTGQEIVASGAISGSVPVIISPDGSIDFEASRMSASDRGVISIPSNVIPGQGDQIDLTRQILDNFAYDNLLVEVQEVADGDLAVLLSVSGNNPKVYGGRPVKLNVRLGGDVLEFLQSNIKMMMQPESILQEAK